MAVEPVIMRRELINGVDILCKQPSQVTEEIFVQTIMHFSQLVDELSQGSMKIHVTFDEKRMQEIEGKK